MRYTAVVVPVSQRCFAPGQLQFITSSVYCRMKLFDSPRLRGEFIDQDKRRASPCASRRSGNCGMSFSPLLSSEPRAKMTAGLETPSFRLRPEDVSCRWLAPPVGPIVSVWTWGELNPQLRTPSRCKREPSLTPTKQPLWMLSRKIITVKI
jgi:hypothetical protein